MVDQIKDIDSRLASSLEKLIQVQRVLLWDIAKKENLSPIQIQFMIFINRRSPEFRKVSVLAEEFDLTKATVSNAITNLENKGLIRKTKTDIDKRSYTLEPTQKGKRISKKIEDWQKTIIDNIRKISYRDKETAYRFLTDLIKSLFDNGVINTARLCITCGNIRPGTGGIPNKCVITGREFFYNEVNINCDGYRLKSND
jgi:DNA-binding MarR family transcriptional regulator